MDNLRDVLIRPLVTEKSNILMTENKYVFKVALKANKIEIRNAVEKIFNVKVLDVKTLIVNGKIKRMGKTAGYRPDYKKAIVKLAPGNRIEIFEGV
ncbi:MAG: 50S ribosomal protein L23 [Bacillota bacterium]